MANLQTPSKQHIDYDNETSEIIAAIVDGHYSWACVLYLQSIGHEPTAYMPHRTYTRIVRKHYSCKRSM